MENEFCPNCSHPVNLHDGKHCLIQGCLATICPNGENMKLEISIDSDNTIVFEIERHVIGNPSLQINLIRAESPMTKTVTEMELNPVETETLVAYLRENTP